MPSIDLEVGEIAQDVAEQVADIVATAKTEQLLQESAEAEEGRVLAEQARVEAEAGRQAELDAKITYGSKWFDGTGGVHYAEESDLADNIKTNEGAQIVDAVAQFDPISQAVEDGSYAKMDNMKGRSFAYNQLLSLVDETVTHNGITLNTQNNKVHIYGTATSTTFFNIKDILVTQGHVMLAVYGQKSVSGSYRIGDFNNGSSIVYDNILVKYGTVSSSISFGVEVTNGATVDINLEPNFFDLTAMDLDSVTTVAEAMAALRSYGIEPTVYNEYSAGKIIDSQPNKIISRGVNLYNEEYESGYWDIETGQKQDGSTWFRSKNPTRVSPNTTYFAYWESESTSANLIFRDASEQVISYTSKINWVNKSFTTPSNCYDIVFYWGLAASWTPGKITIAKGTTNPGYHAFVKDEHDLVLPVMRSAGSVADDKDLVRIGTVDLGSLSGWSYNKNWGFWASSSISSLVKLLPDANTKPNALCSTFEIRTNNQIVTNTPLTGLTIYRDNGNILINNGSSTVTPTGILNYELATPVPQDPAISLPQNIKVWNGGSLETQYEAPNTTPGLISLTYQANIKAMVEGMSGREDINWNPENVVSQAQLGQTNETIRKIIKGEQPVGKADLADNLDSKLGITDTTPFLSRTTAGGEEVANTSKVHKIIGGSLPIVQLIRNGNFTSTSNWNTSQGTTFSVANNVGSFIVNQQYGSINQPSFNLVAGHKYMFIGSFKCGSSAPLAIYFSDGTYVTGGLTITTAYKTLGKIISAQNTGTYTLLIQDNRASGWDTINLKNLILIDLTTTFGVTIANRLYALETANAGASIAKAKQILIKDYYPYNVTDFTHVKTTGKVNTGFNQLDLNAWFAKYGITDKSNLESSDIYNKPLWENNCNYNGRIAVYRTGITRNSGTGTIFIQFNYMDGSIGYGSSLVNTGVTKSESNKVVKSVIITYDTGAYFNFTNAKMCISFYWDGERDGEYEDYQDWSYPCSDVELKGVISLDANDNWVYDGDEYLPGGIIDENYYEYTFTGNETWQYSSGGMRWCCELRNMPLATTSDDARLLFSTSANVTVVKNKGTYQTKGWFFYGTTSYGGLNELQYCDPDNFPAGTSPATIFTAGTKLIFRKAAPTTSSADSYTEQQNGDNWGAERWIDERDVPLPVSAEIEYLPDLKAKTESQPGNPDSDGDYVMHRENGENSYTPLADWLVANGYPAVQDVSSGVTDVAGLTYSVKKAYNIGNIVELSLMIQNKTGSSIPNQTTLFNLGSSIKPLAGLLFAYTGTTPCVVGVSSNGDCNCSVAIANNDFLFVNISYAVA